jgi:predicted porin
MRNTKIALAVLALVASTAAMADSATLYGSFDTSVAKQSGGRMAFDGSGNWNGTVLGIQGSEDLEGGMKATYNVEMGLNLGTGQHDNGGTSASPTTAAGVNGADAVSAANVFNRKANVGLAGDFGSIKAGLQLSPFIAAALNGVANNNESFYVPLLIMSGNRTAEMFGAGGATAAGGTATGGFFIPNAVSYTTPSVSGFNATLLKQLDAGAAANQYYSYNATYAAGDISVAAGYQNRDADYTGTVVTGAYQMGAAKLTAGYIKYQPVGGTDVNTYNLGGSYAVSDKVSTSLQYARNNATAAATITNLGVQYSLSKRTHLYTTVSRATNGAAALYSARGTGVAANTPTAGDTTGYAVGVYHTF